MSFSKFIEACNENDQVDVTHVICSTQDNIIAEYIKPPYEMDSLKLFFSMTKSITSLAIGIANDLGLINLTDKIIKYFDKELPLKPHKNLKNITVKDLLTMSCGIHENTYSELFVQNNWVSAFLAQDFPHEPGTFYRYSTHGSHMLSVILTKATNLSLEEFLNKHLFYPMGIYEAQWELSPEKHIAGGMGLSLYPKSLVKISQLLLNEGVYEGKQLISKKYLSMATSSQIIKQDDTCKVDNIYSGDKYGFQIHIGNDDCYRFDGAFGQLCLISPKKNMSVVIFSNSSKMETLLSLIYRHLLNEDIFDNLSEISEFTETGNMNLDLILNKLFVMSSNKLEIKSVNFSKSKNCYRLLLKYQEYENVIDFSFGQSTRGKIIFIKDLQNHLQDYICFTYSEEDSFSLKLFLIETPYILTYKISFIDNLQIEFNINNSFTLKNEILTGNLYSTK